MKLPRNSKAPGHARNQILLANSFRERQKRELFIDLFEISTQAPEEERHITGIHMPILRSWRYLLTKIYKYLAPPERRAKSRYSPND